MGFKPLEFLRDYHNLKEPTFVYPTDKELKGSTTAFIALHQAMLTEPQRFAVASMVSGRAGAPQLVALLAQQEECDDTGEQVRHPNEKVLGNVQGLRSWYKDW